MIRFLQKPMMLTALAALIATGVVAYVITSSSAAGTDDATNDYMTIHGAWAFDVTDKRLLVGFSDDVFVGRVIKQVGSQGAPSLGEGTSLLPQTQFKVSVKDAIKGDLNGTVIVNQSGGTDAETGELYLVDGNPLLEPKQTYLFSTKYSPENDWHEIVVEGYGDVPFKNKSEKKQKELKEKFKKAKKNQIDKFNHPPYNSSAPQD